MLARRLMAASGGIASGLDPDAVTLIAAMDVTPNAARQQLISDHIVQLKADGVWALLDTYYVMAAHHEQASRLNWKSPGDFTLTANGGITFTTDRGWQGDGSTGYLDTGWIPATHGVNYALNNASFGAYIRTHSETNVRTIMGARDIASTISAKMAILFSTDSTIARVNTDTNVNQAAISSVLVGLNAGRRSAVNSQNVVRNGAIVATGTASSENIPIYAFYISATNNGVNPVGEFDNRPYASAFTGAAMTTAQHAALYDAQQNGYLAAVGAAV
jgi:hypothetical protein